MLWKFCNVSFALYHTGTNLEKISSMMNHRSDQFLHCWHVFRDMAQACHFLLFEKFQNSYQLLYKQNILHLPPFSFIRDFGKQNTWGNISKISVNLKCYRHVGWKSTNHSPLLWCRERQVTLVAVIGGFRSNLSITRKTDGNFGNVSAGVLFSKVAYQRKRW